MRIDTYSDGGQKNTNAVMYSGMSLTMNELFNYEHTQSVKGCTPKKENIVKSRCESSDRKQGYCRDEVMLQTLQNTTGLILRHVTGNQQVYPNGRKENSYQFFFLT